MKFVIKISDKTRAIELQRNSDRWQVWLDGEALDADAVEIAQPAPTKLISSTVSPSIFRSMVTVDPHNRDNALAVASGADSRPIRGMVPASSMIRRL